MGDFQRVSDRLWVARVLVQLVVAGILAGVAIAFDYKILIIPLLILTVLSIAFTIIQVKHTAWLAGTNDVIVRKGRLWQRITYVPYGRVQYFEVTRGLLAHCFGYASIQVHTASTSGRISIPGIPYSEADKFKEYLSERARQEISGL